MVTYNPLARFILERFSALLVGLFIDGRSNGRTLRLPVVFQCPFGWAVH